MLIALSKPPAPAETEEQKLPDASNSEDTEEEGGEPGMAIINAISATSHQSKQHTN